MQAWECGVDIERGVSGLKKLGGDTKVQLIPAQGRSSRYGADDQLTRVQPRGRGRIKRIEAQCHRGQDDEAPCERVERGACTYPESRHHDVGQYEV